MQQHTREGVRLDRTGRIWEAVTISFPDESGGPVKPIAEERNDPGFDVKDQLKGFCNK
ncbi:MAG: hypothetical protein WC362_01635 [Methanoregula sp.]|jgi:hypothetical protein